MGGKWFRCIWALVIWREKADKITAYKDLLFQYEIQLNTHIIAKYTIEWRESRSGKSWWDSEKYVIGLAWRKVILITLGWLHGVNNLGERVKENRRRMQRGSHGKPCSAGGKQKIHLAPHTLAEQLKLWWGVSHSSNLTLSPSKFHPPPSISQGFCKTYSNGVSSTVAILLFLCH